MLSIDSNMLILANKLNISIENAMDIFYKSNTCNNLYNASTMIDQSTMEEHQEFVENEIVVNSKDWKKYQVILKSPKTDNNARLRIFLKGNNPVCLEHISLFPVNTFKNRENGMRRDLAQALADMHPGVLRFPGGCIVESFELETRYQWKNTVGPVENRPLNDSSAVPFALRAVPNHRLHCVSVFGAVVA